jgi:hypothetical protein
VRGKRPWQKLGAKAAVPDRENGTPRRTLADFDPWPDESRPADLPEWADVFLRYLAMNGGLELACNAARKHRMTVVKTRQAFPAFDDACLRAMEYFVDSLEWFLVEQAHKTGVPLGFFGRLKAERPARWVDKSLIASLEVKTEVPADQMQEFLASLVQHTTPATRAMLGLDPPVAQAGDPGPGAAPRGQEGGR